MTEHPILFSAPMVRAILEGRKTMTRRVVKPTPEWVIIRPEDKPEMTTIGGKYGAVWYVAVQANEDGDVDFEGQFVPCPYGQPGDRLWVRETWAVGACADMLNPSALSRKTWLIDNGGLWYEADGAVPLTPISPKGKRRPSIFMPRWASRITLELAAVRVERVQDISEYDAGLEGAPCLAISKLKHPPIGLMQKIQAPEAFVYGFYDLWNSINDKRGYGWDANPWVWVVEFKRIEP